MDFPSNSIHGTGEQSRKPAQQAPTEGKTEDRKEIKKVVSGKAVKRKKTLLDRLVSAFSTEGKSIGRFIIDDILKPAFRDTVTDVVVQGVERAVYGEVQTNTRRRGGSRGGFGGGPINYNRYSTNTRTRDARYEREPIRGGHRHESIELASRAEAQAVLRNVAEVVDRYGHCSIADLYEMVGLESEFTDEKWGWTDLYGADTRRTRSGGHVLILPPVEAIG